ncbi:MAG: DUF1987 domain-containing protein [Bacteroidales bacterium]|nr:DUF1987 domain-containing protein [Bacteroidales bacterium]
MAAERLHIEATNDIPGIILNPEGFVRVYGRGLMGFNPDMSAKIFGWIEEYLKSPARITTVIIAMEYLNSFSAKVLVSILKEISRVSEKGSHYFIHWCYEEEDEDILERGEFIAATLNIPIDFIRTPDITQSFLSLRI